jgi:hypothetical protein
MVIPVLVFVVKVIFHGGNLIRLGDIPDDERLDRPDVTIPGR